MQNEKSDMSCARVQTYTAAKIGAAERHNERKNSDYGNVNVDPDRIPLNVHYKDSGESSYMDVLRTKEAAGELSRRGLKADAVLFDEVIFDVNTAYFEKHGGYEYAKEFFAEAYRFAAETYGEENILSAVMHADEINKRVSEEAGHPVYHYHLHVTAFPVVDKEIRWTKRCKDPALVGTVKEVIHQISHSKKWESREQLIDEFGEPVFRKNGKPKYRASYSILQDAFYRHMVEHGFRDFSRGKEGSTAEHLTALQYQIAKDRERLADIEQNIRDAEVAYEPAEAVYKTYSEIDTMGKKTALTGKYAVSKEDYEQLTALAKEGITSRKKISELRDNVRYYSRSWSDAVEERRSWENKYNRLYAVCEPFLKALEHFPNFVHKFLEKVRELFTAKDAAEKAERERRRAEEQAPRKAKQKGREDPRG